MTKTLFVLLALSFVGCGEKKKADADTPAKTTEPPKEAPKPPPAKPAEPPPAPKAPAGPAIPADTDPPPTAVTCSDSEKLSVGGPQGAAYCWARPKTAQFVSGGGDDNGNKFLWQVGSEFINAGDQKQKAEDAYADMEKEARADGGEPVGQGQTPNGKGKYIVFKTAHRLAITARIPIGESVVWCRVGTDLKKPDKKLLEVCRGITPR